MQIWLDRSQASAYILGLERWTCGPRSSESSRVTTALSDVSETYLDLVREHRHRFHEALAVVFPRDAPDLALIELPGGGCVPVRRRWVTDLLEFQRTEEGPCVDERQLDLLSWREVVRLEDPPMTTRITNPERKMVSRRKAS